MQENENERHIVISLFAFKLPAEKVELEFAWGMGDTWGYIFVRVVKSSSDDD